MRDWTLFGAAGFVTAAPIVAFVAGLRHVPMKVVGVLQYLTPTLMLLSSVLYFGVPISQVQILSMTLIRMGIGAFFTGERL